MLVIAGVNSYQWPQTAPSQGQQFRVAGDSEPAKRDDSGNYRSGNLKLEAPLPDGYPAPTPADSVEIKTYPSVRRAEFRSENLWLRRFWG